MKTCRMCGETKPIDQFYADPKAADKHGYRCRDCIRTRYKTEEYREYVRNRYGNRSEEQKIADRIRHAKYCSENRQEIKDRRKKNHSHFTHKYARRLVELAVEQGKITKPEACSDCGICTDVVAHHEDYGKPIDVVWLCQTCHGKRHRIKP